MTTQEYWDELNQHDWYYHYSDDGKVYNRGKSNEQRLDGHSLESDEHKAIFKAFSEHHFSGSAFGTDKAPKPERPGGPKPSCGDSHGF